MQKFLGLSSLCLVAGIASLAAVGCTPPSDAGSDAEVEDAVAVSALQQGADGSDQDFGDATDDSPTLDRECRFSEIRHNLVKTYDVNQDGKLEADERATLREDFGGPAHRLARRHLHREARRVLLRSIYDADGSGTLDASEREELRSDLDARCEWRMSQLISKFDADGDGELSDAEWTAAREDLAKRFQMRREQILAKFDANSDGKLELSERADAWQAVGDAITADWKALVAKFDLDHDGKLSAAEQSALRDELKAKVRGEATP